MPLPTGRLWRALAVDTKPSSDSGGFPLVAVLCQFRDVTVAQVAPTDRGPSRSSQPSRAVLALDNGLLASCFVGAVTWISELWQLSGADSAVSLGARIAVAAWPALAATLLGAMVASGVWGVGRLVSRWPSHLPKACTALGVAVSLLVSCFGAYALYAWSEHYLVAAGTKGLFLAWGMAAVACGALWLGWLTQRLRPRLPETLTLRQLVTGCCLLAWLALSLLAFEPEVFRAIDGLSLLPLAMAATSSALATVWAPPLRLARPLSALALAGLLWASGYGLSVYRGRLPSVVEQHSLSTRRAAAWLTPENDLPPVATKTTGSGGSCWPNREPTPLSDVASVEGDSPDILLVSVDGMRWDHTTMAKYRRNTTPKLADFAKRGALFTRAYSNSASTRQTFRSMLTGLLPSQIEPSRGKSKWALSFPEQQLTLADYLSAAGLHTVAIQTNPVFLEKRSRALRGFETLDTVPASAWKRRSYSADVHVDRLISHLSDVTVKRPTFVFSHMMEPHSPYRSGPGTKRFGKSIPGRYDSSLNYIDRQLERVLRFALSPERRKRTYVIVSSDHGMGLGDRNGLKQHGNSLYDDQTHVPLLIFGPGIQPQRVDEPVSLQDIFPTIIDMAGLKPLQHVCGQSLLPRLRGEQKKTERPVIVEIFADHANSKFRISLVSGRYKLMVDARKRQRSLFDLKADPEETKDLVETQPDTLQKLEQELARILAERGLDPKTYTL